MAQQARPVLIHYHIPADGDEADVPNAFPLLKPGGGVQLRDIRAKFPLAGSYHFRFKTRWGNGGAPLWMDVTNEQSEVPEHDGKIVAKVTRLSWRTAAAPGDPAPGARPAASPAASTPFATPAHSPLPGGSPRAPEPDLLDPSPQVSAPHHAASAPALVSGAQRKNDDFDMLFG